MNNGNFLPHPLFPGGHLQTLAGFYLPNPSLQLMADRHQISLADGDALILHHSRPQNVSVDAPATEPAVLLIHGLAGCHQSGYMQRLTHKLTARGFHVFRLDMRGCGAGEELAARTTHCGRWEDAAAAIEFVTGRFPQNPLYLVGFSLGGAIALNLVGELGGGDCGNLCGVLAICPPIDLPANSGYFETPRARPYDRFFVRTLWRQMKMRLRQRRFDLAIDVARRPRSMREFDELITAPLGGFSSVDEYYRQASPGPKLMEVEVPTHLLVAEDDPVIWIDSLRTLPVSSAVELTMTHSGGHLGYIGRRDQFPDRRWLDWWVVEWLVDQARDRRHAGGFRQYSSPASTRQTRPAIPATTLRKA